jgi:TetR/AcrR family tetracycline transcriptional repressor
VKTEPEIRQPLTRDRILEAALLVMDREGLEAVTMRRLGRELGVEAMSLYNHVEDKDAVLRGILARVLGDLALPKKEDLDWIERIREMSRTFRALLLRHPGVIPLLSEKSGPITDPRALAPIEAALQTLRGAGLSEQDTIHAYRAVVGFVVGNVALEIAGFLNPDDEALAHLEEMRDAIPVERFPRVIELLPAMHACDPDQEFEHGLELLLTGLRTRVER